MPSSSRSSGLPPDLRSRPTITSTLRAPARSTPASCSSAGRHGRARRHLEGYALDTRGARNYLLLDAAGVEWYRSPTPPAAHVDLSAAVSGAAFTLSGRVTGGSGSVEIWRETQAGAELFTTLPLAADGTFCAHRHAADAATHLPRGIPRRERAAALVAHSQRSSERDSRLSTGCTKHCGNVDYSKSAKCALFRSGHPCTSSATP